jgi:REP element-mobilizing transposase RayT
VSQIPNRIVSKSSTPSLFGDSDDRLYRDPLGVAATKAGAEIRAYGLMPNHVHAVVTAKDEAGLWLSSPRFARAHHRSHPCAQPLHRAALAGGSAR